MVSKNLPSSFKDGTHLSLLFTMAHSSHLRGEDYGDFDNSNELALFKFIKENRDLELNVDTILKMYAILSNQEEATFKQKNINIETGSTFYVTASKEKTPKEMEDLCERYKYLNNPKEGGFVGVFEFGLEFICIHPFKNGNGRMMAFLIEFLLMKFGLENVIYTPFDALLSLHMTQYTKEVRKASGFYYGMKEMEYDSFTLFLQKTLMESYVFLIETINKA